MSLTNPVQFTHLHTHTPKGSLLDGYMRIDKAIEKALEWGMDSLGISDHGTMAAHPEFNNLCKENGIKPVFGMEAYITPDKTFKKADFESVNYTILTDDEGTAILNKKGKEQYIFKLFSKEEFSSHSENFSNVLEISPKSTMKKFLTEAKPHIQTKALEILERDYEELALAMGEKRPLSELKAKEKKPYLQIASDRVLMENVLGIEGDAARSNYFQWFPSISHLLLIALNDEGYRNLIALNNIAHLEGFYKKPRIDYGDIAKYGKGIAATSACLGGTIPQLIMKGKIEEAKKEVELYMNAFDEFYFEIQPSKQPEQWHVNKVLIEWSKEMGIPLIATSDVHMVTHDELAIHKQLMNINKGKEDDDDNDISVYDSCYFMHPQEFLDNGIPQEALQNAYDLAHRTNVTILDDNDWRYPVCEIPEGEDYDTYLMKLAEQGLFMRFMNDQTGKMDWNLYHERLYYELEVIRNKKISAYFVIVWDFLNFCHERNILTGPGRGSAAGSLVAYSLGVTNIDPIRWDLLFERFLNPERPGFPDVDSDVDGTRRAEVIDYLGNKYGHDKVTQVGTYITMACKSVLKDIGRVLGINHEEINELNKKIPDQMKLEDALLQVPEVGEFMEKYPDLLELALETESMPKTSSVHACAIVVSTDSLMDSIPLMRGKNEEIVSQYEGPELESIGFIKFDLLGLKNLSVIEGARALVEEKHGSAIDVNNYSFFDDPKVFELIQKGDTDGIFQLESDGMKGVFRGLKKVDFESVIAGVALYRPGPMANIPAYQRRANGTEKITYLSEEYEQFTKNTFGILIYQEQVMMLSQVMAGYSKGESDVLRKAIGKKKVELLDKALNELKTSLMRNGHSEELSDKICEEIRPFGAYGFNRSHAAAYAFVASQTAYFKARYPLEFFTSLLTVNAAKKKKVVKYIEDAKNHGIKILPPDINRSKLGYSIEGFNTIRMGLESVNNLGKAAIDEIVANQPYSSLSDYSLRSGKNAINKKNIETLSLSGVFDSFYPRTVNRMEILADAFVSKGDAENANKAYGEIDVFNNVAKLEKEKYYLGFYFSGHPLDGIGEDIDLSVPDGQTVKGKAIVSTIKEIITKKGDPMAFIDFSFKNEVVSSVVFPDTYNEEIVFRKKQTTYRDLLKEGMVVDVSGVFKYDLRRDERSFIITKVNVPVKANRKFWELEI
ncbi:hypothetical protein A5882_003527 [Enterococcus sp. 4E1_DIV0656]|uniref:DNA polymerase III subunit alpha n=1 Tax=Enterococcus sp. 4E1_DIV0656 TaxID=1834180 RepID=UPI000B673374|nr:DNA polymerase III subunit alpha [Enterococcus sp. 4E1_DIV0656]OTO09197.1 hypothetical protein A5882_003527 [Enterococcus sp. 4E1_DIV0656]